MARATHGEPGARESGHPARREDAEAEPAPGPARTADPARTPARTAKRPTSRRSVLAGSAAAGLGLLAACAEPSRGAGGAGGSADGAAKESASPGAGAPSDKGSGSPSPRRTRKRPQLPRGGRDLFPHYRMVGYCGLPGAAALGRLGTGDPGERVAEIEKKARAYAGDREPLPALELLATVVNPGPGPDGAYRTRTAGDTIHRFHELAREHEALLLLNIQPGRSSALDEVKALREWLVHPDVGIALDPEWDMGAGEKPGDTYGKTSGPELNGVSRYLSELVEKHDLPQKPFVFHQVAVSVVPEQEKLRAEPGVALIKSADGIGSPGMKRDTWHKLVKDMPDGLHTGFKLFYEEDAEGGSRLMEPEEVLKLRPKPEYVMYE
ncbi:hypothetical protein ACWGJ2_28970 [Streptomyces sp. NPDC054796]